MSPPTRLSAQMALVAQDVVDTDGLAATAVGAAVVADLNLTLLIGAVFALVFMPPSLVTRSDLMYKEATKPARRQKPGGCFGGCIGSWFTRPPRASILFTWLMVTNISLLLSMVWYLYNAANPTEEEDIDFYVSIESLYYALCALKYLWLFLVWNLGRYTLAMLLAATCGALIPLVSGALIVLLGLRESWFAFAFMWPPGLFYVALPFWAAAVYTSHRQAQSSPV